MLSRRTFIQSASALAAGAATRGSVFPKGEMKEKDTIGFPKRLDLLNQCSGDRYPMVFKNEAPIELSPIAHDHLWHTTMCGLREAIAILGIEIETSGAMEDVDAGLMIDGECVFKSAIKNVSAFADSFLASKDIFIAETPAGSIKGLFAPNGTRVEIFIMRNEACSTTIRARLHTATYRSTGVRQTERGSLEPYE